MKFFTSPSSPFGRKVKIAAHVLGFYDELAEIAINTLDPASDICDVNPLGKIPALEDNGSTLYDSRVIMEYLDTKAGGGKIIPVGGKARFNVLRRAALTDGILDAAVYTKLACGQRINMLIPMLRASETRSFVD